jgi:hypothetical protein
MNAIQKAIEVIENTIEFCSTPNYCLPSLEDLQEALTALRGYVKPTLDPEMPTPKLEAHFGRILTASETSAARKAIKWANKYTALRGIEAVDVEKLKAEVHEACPKGFYATKCEVIDHLHANGYLPPHKLPVIEGLEEALRFLNKNGTVFNPHDRKLIRQAAQEYARRLK